MMNAMVQPSAREARDAETLAAAADAGPSQDLEAVEYGSGWYHEAAIVASEQVPAQKH